MVQAQLKHKLMMHWARKATEGKMQDSNKYRKQLRAGISNQAIKHKIMLMIKSAQDDSIKVSHRFSLIIKSF
jgi:hypothetical protein